MVTEASKTDVINFKRISKTDLWTARAVLKKIRQRRLLLLLLFLWYSPRLAYSPRPCAMSNPRCCGRRCCRSWRLLVRPSRPVRTWIFRRLRRPPRRTRTTTNPVRRSRDQWAFCPSGNWCNGGKSCRTVREPGKKIENKKINIYTCIKTYTAFFGLYSIIIIKFRTILRQRPGTRTITNNTYAHVV